MISSLRTSEARHPDDPLRPLDRSVNQLSCRHNRAVRDGFVLLILGRIDRLADNVVINLFRFLRFPRLW